MNTNDDIIPKLKFISRLNKGDKINVKNLYIQPNNIINKISRSFIHIDDRTNTNLMSSAGNGGNGGNGKAAEDGVQCNTWRRGQCCDGRSLNKDAYTQCANGVCSFYKDMRDPVNQLFSRY